MRKLIVPKSTKKSVKKIKQQADIKTQKREVVCEILASFLASFIKQRGKDLLVNVLAVSNTDNQHNQFVILNAASHAVIPHTVTPQSDKIAGQWLAKTAGIFISGNTFAKVAQYIALGLTVNFAKLFRRCVVKLNYPGQGLAPSRLESSVCRGSQGD
jgi:hypothetical protein